MSPIARRGQSSSLHRRSSSSTSSPDRSKIFARFFCPVQKQINKIIKLYFKLLRSYLDDAQQMNTHELVLDQALYPL
jgi:hypothetical protein